MVTGWSWNSLLVGLGGWVSSFLIRILFHYRPACENYLFQAPSWSMFLISMCHKTFDPHSCLSTMCSKPLTICGIYTSNLRETLILCRFHTRPYIVRGSLHITWNIRFFFVSFCLSCLIISLYLHSWFYLFICLTCHFNRRKKKKKKDEHLKIRSSWRPHILGKIFLYHIERSVH